MVRLLADDWRQDWFKGWGESLWNWTRMSLSRRVHSDSMNGIQTVDLLPEREARQISFKDDIKLPVTDVNVSPSACFVEADRCVGVRSSNGAFSLTHRKTWLHQTSSCLRTWTPAAPMTTWRTPARTATLTQATARTTVVTAILSTAPIFVAMATSRSKPSCQAQRGPAYRTEVRKQEWMEEAEWFIPICVFTK